MLDFSQKCWNTVEKATPIGRFNKKKIEIFHLEKLITKINCMFFQIFLLKTPTLALLMHSNDVSKLWHINLR